MKFGIVFPIYNTPALKDHLGENDKSFIWDRINKYKDDRKDSFLPYVSRKNKYKFFYLKRKTEGEKSTLRKITIMLDYIRTIVF